MRTAATAFVYQQVVSALIRAAFRYTMILSCVVEQKSTTAVSLLDIDYWSLVYVWIFITGYILYVNCYLNFWAY